MNVRQRKFMYYFFFYHRDRNAAEVGGNSHALFPIVK